MKQFVIAFAAILATSAFAQDAEVERPYILKLAYDSADAAYLGLEVGNSVSLELPGCGKSQGVTECSGWQLVGDYTAADFAVSAFERPVGRGGKTIRAFEFLGEIPSAASLDVQFENDCKLDADGANTTATVRVFVNDFE